MTVEELMKKLSQMPPHAPIAITVGDMLWAEIESLDLDYAVNFDNVVTKLVQLTPGEDPVFADKASRLGDD